MEHRTTVAPADVLNQARAFFARRNSIYAAYVEQQSDRHVTMRGQGGEEIVIAAASSGDHTLVTGSSYLFDAQIARFFATLAPAATQP
jgi:hypothetical protein